MATPLVDLVSGRETEPNPATLLSGRYLLNDNGKGATINGLAACFADRLVARRDGTWSFSVPGRPAQDGEFSSTSLVSNLDGEAIVEMGRTFEALRDSRATWAQWVQLSPLAPKVAEVLRVRAFDRAIQDRLVFLEAVCQNPRTHLRVDEEMTSVPRVRKVARTAIVRLVSHKEDWDRPTVLGVRPRRVLALVAEDDADIYENRLAARLVDHIASYLRHRLEQLSRIRSMIDQSGQYAVRAAGGQFRRQWRLCELWADAVGDVRAEQNAKHTADLIESLYGRVRKLFESSLYRGVPSRSGTVQLRYTNVFESDCHYREVARLWREWMRLGVARPPTEEEVYERRQSLCEGAAWFGWQLVVRALAQLNVGPDANSETAPVDCDVLTLKGPGGTLHALPPRDGAVILRVGSRCIRVICLPARMHGLDEPTRTQMIEDLERAAESAEAQDVIVLLVSSGGGPEEQTLQWLADPAYRAGRWEPGTAQSTRLGVLPVSPWDIGSVERVARVLRWHLWAPMLLQYPPTVALGQDRPVSLPGWAEVTTRPDSIRVLRAPERRELSLNDLLKECRVQGVARVHRQNPKAVRQALEQLDRHLESVRTEVESAFLVCSRICTCPTCATSGALLRQIGQYDCFECHCESCDSVWGVYRCSCGERFPAIRLKDCEELASESVDRSPGWFDRVFGADMLACVCPVAGGKATFVCPACGSCRCGENVHSEEDWHSLSKRPRISPGTMVGGRL